MNDYLKYKLKSLKNTQDKKIISFSVYGEDAKYLLGAIKNVEIAKKYYPDWICRFYCCPQLKDLQSLCEKDCEILVVDSEIPPMFWRFFAADDKNAKAFISRDTDSLVNPRESSAVSEWLSSDKIMHTMHDADFSGGHFSAVMGGMWGLKLPIDFSIAEKINNFTKKRNYKFRYHDDQIFLNTEILSLFKNSCIDHHCNPSNSKYHYSVPFPKHEPFEFGSFVGERISPFKMSINLEKNDLSSEKIFIMPHLGPSDYFHVNGLIYNLIDLGKEIVMPYKSHSKNLVFHLFGGNNKIHLEEIEKDSQAFNLYKSKYEQSHNFVGLGNHGPISKKKSLKEKYYDQCGLQFDEKRFEVFPDKNSNIKLEQKFIDKINNLKTKETVETRTIKSEGPLVSVIVGTYNRWNFLQKTVESIKSQDYKNIEVIVVNDGSTDDEYKNRVKDVVWIDLPKNSKENCGFTCRSYVYNYGISIAKGDYIAFCDDDDAWYPQKISKQLEIMNLHRSKMSCTEAFMGKGLFDQTKEYKLYLGGIENRINSHYKKVSGNNLNNSLFNLKPEVPLFFNKKMILSHNFIIGSSVIISKDIIDKVGKLSESKKYKKGQDKELWLRALSLTDCSFVNEPLTYYDTGHGNGRQY